MRSHLFFLVSCVRTVDEHVSPWTPSTALKDRARTRDRNVGRVVRSFCFTVLRLRYIWGGGGGLGFFFVTNIIF